MVKTSSSAGGVGSIPGQEVKISHASQPKKKQNIKQEKYCNKFSENFKNSPYQNIFFCKKGCC